MKKSHLIDIIIICVLLLLVFTMGYFYLTPRNTDVRDIQLRTLENRLFAFQRANTLINVTFLP